MRSFNEMANESDDILKSIFEAKQSEPKSSTPLCPVHESIMGFVDATRLSLFPNLNSLTEREKATGTAWIDQMKDLADATHDLSKDLREAYLVEKRAKTGEGEPNPEDPETWLSGFADRIRGISAQLKGVRMAYKKSKGAPESAPEEKEELPPPVEPSEESPPSA